MKTLVALTYANYPEGDACAIRLDSMMRLFMKNGYCVKLITMGRTEPNVWKAYKGIEYISVRSKNNAFINRSGNVLFYAKRAYQVMKRIGKIDAVYMTSLPIPAMLMCRRYAVKHNYQLFIDRTEWYSPCEFLMGKMDPQYLECMIQNSVIVNKNFKVISISRYFETYYKNKGITTIRIPAIMDTQVFPKKDYKVKQENEKTVIIYAGSPAKKDSLLMMIESLFLLDRNTQDYLDFRVIGVAQEWASRQMETIPEGVSFYGRIPREDVLSYLCEADFAVLLRTPKERYTKAGFPSKVAESMSSGTPMITNLTSDLGDYLTDGVDSLIVENYSREDFAAAVKRAVEMKKERISEMKHAARKTAQRYFDYRNYSDAISDLIIKGGSGDV